MASALPAHPVLHLQLLGACTCSNTHALDHDDWAWKEEGARFSAKWFLFFC